MSFAQNDVSTKLYVQKKTCLKHTHCLFQCRKLWVSWGDGSISLGRRGYNTNLIATIADPYGPRTYRTLHMTALIAQQKVLWEFSNDAGEQKLQGKNKQVLGRPRKVFLDCNISLISFPGFITAVQTRGGEHHFQAWLTTGDTNVIIFRMTACQDAYALFTPYFGQPYAKNYEICIGVDGNSRTVIKKDYVEVKRTSLGR